MSQTLRSNEDRMPNPVATGVSIKSHVNHPFWSYARSALTAGLCVIKNTLKNLALVQREASSPIRFVTRARHQKSISNQWCIALILTPVKNAAFLLCRKPEDCTVIETLSDNP